VELRQEFLRWADTTMEGIIDRVYRQPQPNRYLASLQSFLQLHLDDEAMEQMVLDGFGDFFARNVCQYDYRHHAVAFVGSIACIYADQLRRVAHGRGVEIADIIKTPMEGLVKQYARCPD